MRGWTRSLLAAGAAVLALGGCVRLGLNTASTNIAKQEAARPAVLAAMPGDGPVTSREDWTNRRVPALRAAFEKEVYGPVPIGLKAHQGARRVVDEAFAGGKGTLEEIDVLLGPNDNGPKFRVALATPKGASAEHPAPLILGEMFCGNPGAMGSDKLSPPLPGGRDCRNSGNEAGMIRLIFGKYIIEAPVEMILDRGYAFATFHPAELAPDDATLAPIALENLGRLLPPERRPTGVIAVWAAAFGWSLDVLDTDPRIDAKRTAIFGHSRDGKAGLVAAAWDDRIEAVLSHQSGKGGGTLTRSYAGESVAEITKAYPHWFAPAYAAYAKNEAAIPVDQHSLVAMIAPRPVLLGNGWKDVWSDPNGQFRAAQGAEPVYELFGVKGLTQTGMKDTKAIGAIDYFIRPGGHGVREVDWKHFLDFCNRWIGKPALGVGAG